MPFPYKNVLVLGATSGLGKALAETILKNSKAKVVVTGRREERLKNFVAQYDERASFAAFDMTKLDQIEGNLKKIITAHPDIDMVVHNAGIMRAVYFHQPERVDMDALNEELTVNYTSVLYTLKYVLPHLLSLGEGTTKNAAFAFVTSGLAITPFVRSGNYSATKAAVHALVYTVREQLARTNVEVIEIAPPLVKTELDAADTEVKESKLPALPLDSFIADVWKDLEAGKTTIAPGSAGMRFEKVESVREPLFRGIDNYVKDAPWWPKDRA
ncbi:hypothetical protein IAR55_006357 [Kwoniella newhampshirensis]|uniref:NAD(P)-binding protein n=1 Tax=Kwoniella newhampshirensis TaxID=1651941 RepID=A0AAW0YUT6_9TREE